MQKYNIYIYLVRCFFCSRFINTCHQNTANIRLNIELIMLTTKTAISCVIYYLDQVNYDFLNVSERTKLYKNISQHVHPNVNLIQQNSTFE